MHLIEKKQVEEKLAISAHNARAHIGNGDTQHGKSCSRCGKLNHLEQSKVRTDRCQKKKMTKDTEHCMTHAKIMRTKRWQHRNLMVQDKRFQFPQHQISNNCKVKNKKQPKKDTCKIQIETGSDGNLMPVRMYKMLFPHIKMNSFKETH